MITLNGYKIVPTIFPDGTQQVWKIPESVLSDAPDGIYTVKWTYESDSEFITLIQLVELLSVAQPSYYRRLLLPYLPYGRQDKGVCNNETFGLRPFLTALLRGVSWHSVTIFDPHSFDYIRSCDSFGWIVDRRMPNVSKLAELFDYVCYPDKGASLRYSSHPNKPTLIGYKRRDALTGVIHDDYEVSPQASPYLFVPEATCLVVDDICDGGRTFILLGKKLKSLKLKASLYVSHGVFSRGQAGVDELHQYYDRIITTDSRPVVHSLEGIEVIPCFE